MQDIRFIVLRIKSLILPVLIMIFTVFLIIFSNSNLTAASSGLTLFWVSVLPSLFPFFIAAELIGYTGIILKLR